jgi:rhodanese-related sulfurtransferase
MSATDTLSAAAGNAASPHHDAALPSYGYEDVRARLLAGDEIALIDVREEDPFAQSHPLWAANFPLSRLELDAWTRIPRRGTPIVVYGEDASGDLAPRAVAVLQSLGYTCVHVLAGGLAGWIAAGGEAFRDVNVPSKSFGELVEETRHTPSLDAEEVRQLIDAGANAVVLDARRFDEYRTMSIPGATSVPGAELVLRVRELAPDPATRVIVNCAGRTRSIIGAQSLVNAGIPNPVAALRNGTIGWKLAGQQLAHGASAQAPEVSEATRRAAQVDARRVADRAGVWRIAADKLATLDQAGRTVYRFDVRTPEEYQAGHLPGFTNAPGGQLVQETDHAAPVRGARIVLADDDGVRADMTASWLAQMGWEVYVREPASTDGFTETGPHVLDVPLPPAVATVDPHDLLGWLLSAGPDEVQVLDFTPSATYVKGHVPGAWFAIRAQLASALRARPQPRHYVFTCGSSLLARFAAADAARLTDVPVKVLSGGTIAWIAAGLPVETGETGLASARTDRYRRPYEGTDAPPAAMQAYLDWEYGLTAQLARDGTHGFKVI